MSSSTIDHAPPLISSAVTPPEPLIIVMDAGFAAGIDTELINALSVPAKPDPNARARFAKLLYESTGWEIFRPADRAARENTEQAGYAQLAAEYASEDAERRRIARRRPRTGSDED